MKNRPQEVGETTMSNRENEGLEPPPSDGKVGYGKPPMQRRFKGSGNLKGRPKGAKNRKTIVRTVANEIHTVVENGKRRKRSTLELVLLSLRNMALEGKNVGAIEEFHRLIKVYQPQETDDNVGYLVVPAPLTDEEYRAKGEKLNAVADARHAARIREKELLAGRAKT